MIHQVLWDQKTTRAVEFELNCAIQKIASEFPNFRVKIIQLTDVFKDWLPTRHGIHSQALLKSPVDYKAGVISLRQLFFNCCRQEKPTFWVQSGFILSKESYHLQWITKNRPLFTQNNTISHFPNK